MQKTAGVKFHLPRELIYFSVGLVVFVIACFGIERFNIRVLHLARPPYNSSFLHETYPDFLLFRPRFAFFHTFQFFTYAKRTPYMYPAPLGVVYKIFYSIPRYSLRAFLMFSVSVFGIAGLMFSRVLWRRGLYLAEAVLFPLLVLLCCYPIWFEIKQANMEVVVWLLVTTGLACFLTGRSYLASICFGVAASMKIYPAIYLALPLIRRQYRALATGIAASVVVTLTSLWLVYPNIIVTYQKISDGINLFQQTFVLQRHEPEFGFDHSLFGLIKASWINLPDQQELAPYLTAYLATVALLIAVLLLFRVVRLPLLNQILFLTVSSILFPPSSFEYTLVHLLAPLALIVLLVIGRERRGLQIPGLSTALFTLLILLAPLPEIIILRQLRREGQFKCIWLIFLWVVALRFPFPLSGLDPKDEGDREKAGVTEREQLGRPPFVRGAARLISSFRDEGRTS